MKKIYQVWSQGYMANGTEGKYTSPDYHGACLAKSFEEACIKIFKVDQKNEYFDVKNNTYYNCKLFSCFEDALESIKENGEVGAPTEYGYLHFKKIQ